VTVPGDKLREMQTEIKTLRTKLDIAVKALKQCKVYSECYEELIMTIDDALAAITERFKCLTCGSEGEK
jgi:hypothetical protein